MFRSFVLKSLLLAKQARLDVLQPTTFLCSCVCKMKFLSQTRDDVLTLAADDSKKAVWKIDAVFAVHDDMRSHTGGCLTFGEGAIISGSSKQKLNARSSIDAKVIARDDFISPMLWVLHFLEKQGYKFKHIVDQDNKSAICLGVNGRASATRRSRHMNI